MHAGHAPPSTPKRWRYNEMERMTHSYFLSRQANVCVANDVLFILDTITGKYLSLDKRAAASLSGSILDWPVDPGGNADPALLLSLRDRGLVTEDPELGKSAAPCVIELPTRWVRESEPRGSPHIALRDARAFTASVSYAAFGKRLLPFRRTAARVCGRKAAGQSSQPEAGEVARLVRIFDWLRPLAFRKTDECFMYCLALTEFLSRYGVFPSWVFGVRADPFRAHCWLQHSDLVLTDIPYNLRRMTPILVL